MGRQITDVAARMSSPWPAHTVSRTELNPVSFLYRSAAIHPERIAVVHVDRRYSYRELCERVNRLASRSRGAGLERHDRVAALCLNTPALLSCTMACRRPAACSSRSTHALGRLRSAPSSSIPAPGHCSWMPSSSR